MTEHTPVFAPRAAAATSQPLATSAAVVVLEAGGNAIDAAVTAAAVLNVVEPHMTGIGGDMFAMVWSVEDQRLHGLDASGRAGSLVTPETLRARGHTAVPQRGPESVTVPGALAGWAALLERFGTISLAEALAPAIRIADGGFLVTPIIARQWRGATDLLLKDSGARTTFLLDGSRGPDGGERFTNPDLARSFRRVSEEGIGTLYGGTLGNEVSEELRRMGGYITLEDLARNEVRWVDPIFVDFHEHTIWELPPAGQGIAALQMLELIQPFDLKGMGQNSAEYLHCLIEAKKLAFADLARCMADTDHMEVRVRDILEPSYVASRRALIDPAGAADEPDPGAAATESETIYLSVTDEDGNMVSFINSIFGHFGSGVVIPGTGFALQNRGAGFTLQDGHPNQVAPGKRPFHTIIPGFVTSGGQPWMTFGVMGGSMQPQGHVQLLVNMLVFGMNVQEAIDAPRFRHIEGLRVALESAIPADVRNDLHALGHDIVDDEDVAFGGAQAIVKGARGWTAGSDRRKDGMAAGT